MSEELKQAIIEVEPYRADLLHDIGDIVYDHFSDEKKAGACADYASLAVEKVPEMAAELAALRAEVERLREALAQYADKDNWSSSMMTSMLTGKSMFEEDEVEFEVCTDVDEIWRGGSGHENGYDIARGALEEVKR
jgi:uncharacterized small protein (DUF1192 family)